MCFFFRKPIIPFIDATFSLIILHAPSNRRNSAKVWSIPRSVRYFSESWSINSGMALYLGAKFLQLEGESFQFDVEDVA